MAAKSVSSVQSGCDIVYLIKLLVPVVLVVIVVVGVGMVVVVVVVVEVMEVTMVMEGPVPFLDPGVPGFDFGIGLAWLGLA